MTANAAGTATSGITIGGTGDVTNTAANATGGTGSNSSSGGGGSSDREQYYQIYRAINQVLGIKGDPRVMAMAFKTRQPGSGYLSLVKKFDPAYLKTDDFKNNAAQFVAKWKEFLPGIHVDYDDMKKYVRGDYSNERIEQVIMKTKAFKQAYPYFRYGDHNVQQYREYQQAVHMGVQSALGVKSNDRQEEMFFKYDMTPEDFDQRAEEFVTGRGALDLMYGNQQKTGVARANDYLFNTPGNLARRAILKQAVQTQQGLNESKVASAGLKRDERTGRVLVNI